MLKENLRYLISFSAGLVVSVIIPVKATPDVLHDMSSKILAQAQNNGYHDYALGKLDTCLRNSGYAVAEGGTSSPVPNPETQTPSPETSAPNLETPAPNLEVNYVDGIIDNKNANCLRIRKELAIQDVIACIPNGQSVQILLKQKEPITPIAHEYNNHNYIFVISYLDGTKGWMEADSIDYSSK